MVPELLVELFPLLLRHVEGVLLVQIEAETTKAALTIGEELGIGRFELVLLLGGEISFAHWYCQVWSRIELECM